jgi:hypothetical protein
LGGLFWTRIRLDWRASIAAAVDGWRGSRGDATALINSGRRFFTVAAEFIN